MNPNKTTDSRNRKTEEKSTVGKRTLAVILTGTALTLALAGCGSSAPSAKESAQVSTSEETQQAAAEETASSRLRPRMLLPSIMRRLLTD